MKTYKGNIFDEKVCDDDHKHEPDHPGSQIRDVSHTGRRRNGRLLFLPGYPNGMYDVAQTKVNEQTGAIRHQRMIDKRKQKLPVKEMVKSPGPAAAGTVKPGVPMKQAGTPRRHVGSDKMQ